MTKNEIRDKITEIFAIKRKAKINYLTSLDLIYDSFFNGDITISEMFYLCRYAEFRFNRQEILELYNTED